MTNHKFPVIVVDDERLIAKNIAKLSVDVNGQIDYIILTGGIAFSKYVTDGITERVKFIAPVEVIAGEKEMDSLAFGALRVLRGEETAHTYEDPAPAKEDLYV